MTTATRLLAIPGLLVLCACSADLRVPKEAKITCAESGCPPGQVCRPEIDLCVTVEDIDTEPPRLEEEPRVDPAVGGPGTVFTVELTANEPLARDPEVTAGERPLLLRDRVELTWTFTYSVTGGEAEGGVPITVRLVDESGNVADGLPCGTLVFDLTAPALVPGSARVDPSVAREGSRVRIGLAVDEVPDEAGVLVGDRPAVAVPPEGDPTSLSFEYTVTGDDPEGEVEVTGWLADAAGNRREGLALGVVRVDTEPPEVLAQEGPASLLRPGDEVTVLLTYSEPAAGEPEVRMVRAEDGAVVVLGRVVISPVTDAFRHTAVDDDHGDWELVLRGLSDEAGNPAGDAAGEVPLASLEVDAVPPGLDADGLTLLDVEGPHRRAGQPVRVAFTTTELVAEPQVVLEVAGAGPQPLAQEEMEEAGDGLRFVYGWTVPADGPQGQGQVSVSLTDLAKNRGGPWTSAPVVLDTRSPVLGADSLLVRPAEGAGIGRLLEVELSAGESLGDATLRVEPAGLELEGPVLSGPRARWTRVVAAGDPEGRFDLVLTAFDLAGNQAELRAPGAVEVDGTRPGLGPEGAEVGPALRRRGARVWATFSASEPLQQAPEVWIGGVEMDQTADSTPERFVYEHVVGGPGEQEGEHQVTAALLDLAGNSATVPLGSVRYDFTVPVLTSTPRFTRCDGRVAARVERNVVWLNQPDCPDEEPALTIGFSLSELPPPGAPPRVVVAGRLLELADPEPQRPSWVAVLDPRGDEPQSSPEQPVGQEVLVESEDLAGNKLRAELGEIRFDFTAPSVEADEQLLARLTWVRHPWGSEDSEYRTRMVLQGPPDVFPDAAEVRVWSVADLAAPGADPWGAAYRRQEIGAGVFTPGVALEVEAGAVDIDVVGFTLLDLAGNEADADPDRGGVQAVPLRSMEWVGTLQGKRPGDLAANPHSLVVGYTRGDEVLELDEADPVVGEADLRGVGRRDEVAAATADTQEAPSLTWPHLVAGFDLRTTRTIEPSTVDPVTRRVLGFSISTSAEGVGHSWDDGLGEETPVLGYSVATSAPVEGGWLPAGVVEGAEPDPPGRWTRDYAHDWSCGEDWCDEATLDRWLDADGHVWVDVAPLAPQGDSDVPAEIRLDYVELRVRYWRTGCEVPSERLPVGTADGTPCTDGLPETEGERCVDFVCRTEP